MKTISIFKSLLLEDKKAYKWWHEDLKMANPTMDRMDWAAVRKEFKARWPPLPEPEDDLGSKREELEQMRLRDRDLGTKVAYKGQELYAHVTFSNQAAHLANKIGDTNSFLLPAIQSQLPEVVKNTLRSLGKKQKTWEELRKVITAIPLSDLWEEATDIANCDSFYTEVAALLTCTSGLTLMVAQMALQPCPALAPAQTSHPCPRPRFWAHRPQDTPTWHPRLAPRLKTSRHSRATHRAAQLTHSRQHQTQIEAYSPHQPPGL